MRRWIIGAIALLLALPTGMPNSKAFAEVQEQNQTTVTPVEPPIHVEMNKWGVIPKQTAAPVIDGVLDDKMWSNATELNDFRTPFYNETVPNGPSYKLSIDGSNLYIGGSFGSQDKSILEKIEFVVSPQSEGELHYVVTVPVSPLELPTVTDWNIGLEFTKENPQRVQVDSFTKGSSDSAGRTYIEVAVPLSAFGQTTLAPGTEWRMNVIHVHHLNTKPLLSWVPIRTSFYWNVGNGSITSYRGNVVDEARLGSLYIERPPTGQSWSLMETEFLYKSFTEKQLSFKRKDSVNPVHTRYTVQWKNPVTGWETLEQVTDVISGERVSLTFQHPEPADSGMYQLQVTAYREDRPDHTFFTILTFDRNDLIDAGIEQAQLAPRPSGMVQVTQAPASEEVQKVLDRIPEKVGFIFTGLPEMPELYPSQLFKMSPDQNSLIALKTGTIYPNSQYPETHKLTAVNRKGETVEYPYYEDEEGKRYFLSAHLWYLQKDYAKVETERISRKDPLGAARLLYRFAQMYEGYVPTNDYIWNNSPINAESGPGFNYWGGMWYRWSAGELTGLRPLLAAYDEVKKTNALELLSEELGVDVEEMIVEHMIIPSVDFVRSYPATLSNMNYTQWLGLIDAGKIINNPDYVHIAFEWMQAYMETQFLSDGYWKEVAPSYHVQSTNGLGTAANALNGYSDPDGYVSPRSGIRLDDLDLRESYPIIDKSLVNNHLLVYPNGKLLPIQDSWASDRSPSPILDAGSLLMPAAGIGRFTAGEGASQSQLYMQFVPKYGHNHYDPLQLNLYALGQELLPDLGYTYTNYRPFSISTMGHNTVVVDSSDMKLDEVSKHGGNIQTFATGGIVQMMRADQKEAYPVTEQYNREPWLVSFPGAENGEGYVLDLFRVSGGNRHEYTLQGDADRDAIFQTDLALDPYGPYLLPPGTQVREPELFNDRGDAEGHYYGYIGVKDVQKAQLHEDRFDVTLVTSENGAEQAKMKITGLLDSGNNELYLARSPSIRTTRLLGRSGDTNDEAIKYDMPKLVLRRDGTNLKSTFVTAMEPYKGAFGPKIELIERLNLSSGPEGAVAVKVAYGDTIDILLSSPGNTNESVIVDDITMRGQMGFIRMVDGVVQSMYLVGGTHLSKGNRIVTGDGAVTGVIKDTKRIASGDPYDGIIVDTEIGAEAANRLRGQYVVITHPDQTTNGYLIREVISGAGQSEIVFAEHDPGFEIQTDGTSEMKFHPAKSWTGTHTFRIDNVDVYDANPLQALRMQADKRELLKGESENVTLTAVLRDGSLAPSGAAKLNFTSSDPKIVSVDGTGKVTGVGNGTAVVTATARLNGITKTASLLFSSQPRVYQASRFVDLRITEQTVPTLYVAGSNTLQFEANQAGASITFEFEVPEEASYEFGFKPFMAASYGIYRILIDGTDMSTYNFYGTTGAGQTFMPIGTVSLAPGKHTLSFVNDGKDSRSTNYKFGVRELEIKERLLSAPVLSIPSGDIFPNEPVEITFADDAAWRSNINSIMVNGLLLASDQFTVNPGRIVIAPGAVSGIGVKWITVQSHGYLHTGLGYQLLPGSALSALSVNKGTLTPAFEPGVFEYAVGVGNEDGALTVTAAGYRQDSKLAISGQTYTGGAQAEVALQVGDTPLPITVTTSNGETSRYDLTVYRSGSEDYSVGTVTGVVYGPGDFPISGARIYIPGYYSSSSVYTDVYGTYLMPNAPAGLQRVVVTRAGYTPYRSSAFQVVQGQNVTFNAVLTDTIPPVLNVAGRYALAGDPLFVTTDEPARVFLVPEGTSAEVAALEAAAAGTNGSVANTTAETPTQLDTTGMPFGKYMLYGLDLGGNLTTEPVPIMLIEEGVSTFDNYHPAITYTGQWPEYVGNYIGGKVQLGRVAGATVEIPFYGAQATWVGSLNGLYGIANVYLDGAFVKQVDMYRSSLLTKVDLFKTGPLEPGVHVLKIEATGQKNSLATGTNVSFDALVVTDLGLTLPVLSGVTTGPITEGMPVTAVSSEGGALYLVPSSTTAIRSALDQAIVTVGEAVYGLKSVAVPGVTVTFDTTKMAPGLYKVYGVDKNEIVSLGSAPIAIVETVSTHIDSESPLVSYTGTWSKTSNVLMFGGNERIGTGQGSIVEIPFYGTEAVVYGTKASNGGLADIYVDGELKARYDYYNGGTGVPMSLLWSTGTLPLGLHTIKIVNIGEKNPKSVNIWTRFDVLKTTAP